MTLYCVTLSEELKTNLSRYQGTFMQIDELCSNVLYVLVFYIELCTIEM